jgi:O-antigen/teichoic acid export membrane protein
MLDRRIPVQQDRVVGSPQEPARGSSEFAERTTGITVVRSSLWNAGSLILPQLYVLAVSVMAARFLTPNEMGRQSYIAFIALSLVMLMTGGVPAAVQRFGSEALGRGHVGNVWPLLRWAARIELIGASLGAGVMIGSAALGSAPSAAWVFAGVFCALGILQTVPAAALAAMQRWRGVSILGIVSGAIATVVTLVVLALGGGITGIFVVEAITMAFNFAITARLARRALRGLKAQPVESRELRRRTARWALIATFTGFVAFVVWRRSEFLFLNELSSDSQIAVYSIAFAAINAITRLPEAAGVVVSPAFATLFGARQMTRIHTGYARAIRLILLGALPLTAVTIALGPIATRLVYGGAYREAGTLLIIMAPTLPLLALVSVSRGLIFGLGLQRVLVIVGVFAALLNITLDFLLITRYDATGAAIANATAQGAAAAAYVWFARQALGPIAWERGALARNCVAAVASGAAAWGVAEALGGVAGLLVGFVACLSVYGGLAIAFRVVPPHDRPWLDELLEQHLHGRPEAVARRVLSAASRV